MTTEVGMVTTEVGMQVTIDIRVTLVTTRTIMSITGFGEVDISLQQDTMYMVER